MRETERLTMYFGVIIVLFGCLLAFTHARNLRHKYEVLTEITVPTSTPEPLTDLAGIEVVQTYDLTTRSYEQICLTVKHITAYNALPNQTNKHPYTMASNRTVYEGAVAISQDIIDKYKLKFGDIVYIKDLMHYYIFEDKMAYGRKEGERVITDTIDIFMYNYDDAKTFHLTDQDVVIFKINRNQ